VIAPARTGRESNRRKEVMITDQINNGVWSHDIPGVRMLIIVVIKLIAPRIEDIPAK